MTNEFDLSKDGAAFNTKRTNRFALWRIWDATKPALMFIGLNPSTANETKDDPTIKKIRKIAERNGYGALFMLNLFPIVSKDPEILTKGKVTEADQAENLLHLDHFYFLAGECVFAWGNFPEAKGDISRRVINRYSAMCLKQNKDGSPKHPLYCADNSKLIDFK